MRLTKAPPVVVPPDPALARGNARWYETLEAFCGVAMACLFGALFILGLLFVLLGAPERPSTLYIVAAWCIWAVLAAGHVTERGLEAVRPTDWRQDAARWGLIAFILFGTSYALNVYLLMTITSLRRSPRAVELLWRARFPLDILLTAAMLFGASKWHT